MLEAPPRVRAGALPILVLLLLAPLPAAGDDPGSFADLSGEWSGTIQMYKSPACDRGGRVQNTRPQDIKLHFTVQPNGEFKADHLASSFKLDGTVTEKRLPALSGRIQKSLKATARQTVEATCDGTMTKIEVTYEGRLARGKKQHTLSLDGGFVVCAESQCSVHTYYKLTRPL